MASTALFCEHSAKMKWKRLFQLHFNDLPESWSIPTIWYSSITNWITRHAWYRTISSELYSTLQNYHAPPPSPKKDWLPQQQRRFSYIFQVFICTIVTLSMARKIYFKNYVKWVLYSCFESTVTCQKYNDNWPTQCFTCHLGNRKTLNAFNSALLYPSL